jgi:hypothetical protein
LILEAAPPIIHRRTRHHDGVKLRQLVRLQPWRATAAPTIAQTIDPLRVVADHPIAQRLPIHTSRLRRCLAVHADQRVGDRLTIAGESDCHSEALGSGTVVMKFHLRISKEEQKRRLLARLDEPAKRWKFSADVAERKLWDRHMEAYMNCHWLRSQQTLDIVARDWRWSQQSLSLLSSLFSWQSCRLVSVTFCWLRLPSVVWRYAISMIRNQSD